MTPEKKSESIVNLPPQVRKAIAGGIVAVSLATGCNALVGASITEKPVVTLTGIPTKDPETNIDPTQVAYEFTPTPKVTETMINEPNSIELDLDSIVFPPIGYAKEAYEKGEYEDGLRNINQWVSVWDRMGFFNESIKVDQLKPVVLDGSSRIVCVASKDDQYTKTLYCPPIDMEQGGLAGIPELGFEQELDKPLVINFEGAQELVTRGKGKNLVYQFIDKYQKTSIKYIDAKTGEIEEGDCGVQEIELPEIVLESMKQVPELSFNMVFKDPKAAYRMLLETVVGDNLKNQQFWQETLGTSTPSVDQLLSFARNNIGGPENKPYWLPFNTDNGTKFNFLSIMGTNLDLRMVKPKIDGVYVDGIYSIFFHGKDLNNPVVYNFINTIKRDNLKILIGPIHVVSGGITYEEFGLLFFDNRFIYLSGDEGKNFGPNVEFLLGGEEGIYRPERDPAIISAQFLSYLDAMSNYDPEVNCGTKGQVCTIDHEICSGGIFSGNINLEDWVVKSK